RRIPGVQALSMRSENGFRRPEALAAVDRAGKADAAVAADPGLVDVPAVDCLHDFGVPPTGAVAHLYRLRVPGRVRCGGEWQEERHTQHRSPRETGRHGN